MYIDIIFSWKSNCAWIFYLFFWPGIWYETSRKILGYRVPVEESSPEIATTPWTVSFGYSQNAIYNKISVYKLKIGIEVYLTMPIYLTLPY